MKPITIKIAGVSVNLLKKPSMAKMIELALTTKNYKYMPIKKAKAMIVKELKANGFTQPRKSKRKKSFDKK